MLLSPTPFQNTPKQTVLLPSAKPGQFQNMPLRGTIFQKSRSLQLSFPGHSSAPSISHESGWPARSLQHHQLCCRLLQAAFPTDLSSDLVADSLHDLISSLSYGMLVSTFFVSSPVSLILFQLSAFVRARVTRDTRHLGWAHTPP